MELHSVQLKSKRRINIDLPGGMVEKLDELACHGNCSRSELIRILISEKLAERESEEFERVMKEGYLANYNFIKESSTEWDFTLGDGVDVALKNSLGLT